MRFGERMQAIALPAAGADARGARPHDAHDPRRDPQRHAVGLYRDGRAEGPAPFDVIRKHALPNAIAPIINVVMLNLAYLVVGVVVVEVIFVYPGMGQYHGRPRHQARRAGGAGLRPGLRRRLHHPQHHRRHRGDRRQSAAQASASEGGMLDIRRIPHRRAGSASIAHRRCSCWSPIFAPLDRALSAMAEIVGDVWEPMSAAHWLGTDNLGRDLLSRLIYGARITLFIAVLGDRAARSRSASSSASRRRCSAAGSTRCCRASSIC